MHRKSRNNAGRTASRPDRKAGLLRSFLTSGPPGISPKTRKRRRACWFICRNRRRLKRWSQPAADYIFRPFRNKRHYRYWTGEEPRKGRCFSITIRTKQHRILMPHTTRPRKDPPKII